MDTKAKIDLTNPDHRCSPSHEFECGSCYTTKQLIQIGTAYNKYAGLDKINIKAKSSSSDECAYKTYLLEQLIAYLGAVQKKWLGHPSVQFLTKGEKDELFNYTFRFEGPANDTTWLTNHDIDRVMKQYMKKYPNFLFVGAIPSDSWKKNICGVKDINFKTLQKKGINYVGIVFNIDPSYKQGSHWVAVFIDFSGKVYFFDSVGEEPIPPIKNYIARVVMGMVNELGLDLDKIDCRYNHIRNQFGSTECGVYSMSFILRLLKGMPFDVIINNPVDDKRMRKCRIMYFTG